MRAAVYHSSSRKRRISPHSHPVHIDDRTVGLILRALRRRRGWRQADLAARAACSQSLVSLIERGHLSETTLGTLRALFLAVEARLDQAPRWRGAELDRLLDSEHAAIEETLIRRLESASFAALAEVTYSIDGERGSIDVLGVKPARRAALVCEVKSDVAAAEAVGRKLDEKGRLALSIVRDRIGWTPAVVGVVLVMPESNRLRRLMSGPAAVLARMYPIDSRRVTSWLREPAGPLAATWFLSDITGRSRSRVEGRRTGPRRAGEPLVLPPLSVRRHQGVPPSRIPR